MNTNFELGMIFEETYPPEAAYWCDLNNAQIETIGERRYRIISNNPELNAELEEPTPVAEPKTTKKRKTTKTSK